MRMLRLFTGGIYIKREIINRSMQQFFDSAKMGSVNSVRIGYRSPSGRPVIMRGTDVCKVSISLSHVDDLTALVIDDQISVGIDLVRLSDAGKLRDWAVRDNISQLSSIGAAAFCWAAREAAYKATALDIPFKPDSFSFSELNQKSFTWLFNEGRNTLSGKGIFQLHETVICAIADCNAIDRG